MILSPVTPQAPAAIEMFGITLIQTRDLLLAIFLFIVAFGGALAAMHRWIVQPLQRADRRVAADVADEELEPIKATLEEIQRSLADIRYEVRINSGASLKDAVLGIQRDLAVLKSEFTAHKEQHHP